MRKVIIAEEKERIMSDEDIIQFYKDQERQEDDNVIVLSLACLPDKLFPDIFRTISFKAYLFTNEQVDNLQEVDPNKTPGISGFDKVIINSTPGKLYYLKELVSCYDPEIQSLEKQYNKGDLIHREPTKDNYFRKVYIIYKYSPRTDDDNDEQDIINKAIGNFELLDKTVLRSIKAYLYTNAPITDLEEISDIENALDFSYCDREYINTHPGKLYFIKFPTEDRLKFKRKYENKPNFWERIFGFDDRV
jgi:hypothetical protein